MKISCYCGELLRDQTDDLPHKGHLIPDQELFNTFDAIDTEVIDALAEGTVSRDEAYMRMRSLISRFKRLMYQCPVCGRLYVDDRAGNLHCYTPADEVTSKEILRSRDAS